ncbi:MAG: S4 domain-containing protein [Candidatus Saccharibacteria bacterium]
MNEDETSRLDVAVQKQLSDVSRASAAKLIEGGYVKVNSKVNTKTSLKVRPTDKIAVNYDFNAVKDP